MTCPNCGAPAREFERHCAICQHDCGYPNSRAAEKPEEINALEERLEKAEASAARRGCDAVLVAFRDAMKGSQAVLCQRISAVQKLISSDNELYASFYDLVGIGARRPEDTKIEIQRTLAADILFPHYRDNIRFAALSLNGRGVARFGDCALTLKEMPIRDRATVFEENSLYFCKRRQLGVKNPSVPPGYRANWSRRDQLAAAKLEAKLVPGLPSASFPDVLLTRGGSSEEDDFVEVHIYGPLHRLNIAGAAIRKPKQRADRAILKQMEASLKSAGATVEIYK